MTNRGPRSYILTLTNVQPFNFAGVIINKISTINCGGHINQEVGTLIKMPFGQLFAELILLIIYTWGVSGLDQVWFCSGGFVSCLCDLLILWLENTSKYLLLF